MYEDVLLMIEQSDIVRFGPFGEGVSEEWIKKAESRLGRVFPPSYVWWLKNFSGGEIDAEEIYSIYEIDFDTANGGDIVFMALKNASAHQFLGTDFIELSRSGEDVFFFDTTRVSDDGEYPICVLDKTTGSRAPYAKSFAEFLAKRIAYYS